MLCQLCQKRPAHVHQEFIHLGTDRPNTKRDLCDVCAGIKTELQFEAEQEEGRQASRERAGQSRALSQEIYKELWEPRSSLMKRDQIRIRGSASDFHWKLLVRAVDSASPEVDPLNVLFGPIQTSTNHVVHLVRNHEVHIIRWHPDLSQYARHLFEVFPQAGARLDLEKRLLFVEAHQNLFPDPRRSLAFCNLAACILGSGRPHKGRAEFERSRFRFKPTKM